MITNSALDAKLIAAGAVRISLQLVVMCSGRNHSTLVLVNAPGDIINGSECMSVLLLLIVIISCVNVIFGDLFLD